MEHTPPLSRPLWLSEVAPEGLEVEIVANAAEREALARLNGLVGLHTLAATLRARRWRGDGLEVEGELRARPRQICVVSLEEFDSDLVAPILIRFAPPQDARRAPRGIEADVDSEDDDPPDDLIGERVDLGAIVSEFLTLALDPYPRKPGAAFAGPAPDAEAAESPFAALRGAVKDGSPGGGGD